MTPPDPPAEHDPGASPTESTAAEPTAREVATGLGASPSTEREQDQVESPGETGSAGANDEHRADPAASAESEAPREVPDSGVTEGAATGPVPTRGDQLTTPYPTPEQVSDPGDRPTVGYPPPDAGAGSYTGCYPSPGAGAGPYPGTYPAGAYPPGPYQPGAYPPGAYAPGYPPAEWAPPRPTNGMAVASLALGITWLWWIGSVLALVFGYLARRQIAERGESGAGLATAGIVLGWIGVGLLALTLAGLGFAILVPEFR
jgi:hypothetical protein